MTRLLRFSACLAGLAIFSGTEPGCGPARPRQNARLPAETGGAVGVPSGSGAQAGSAGAPGEGGSLAGGGDGPVAGTGGSAPEGECSTPLPEGLTFSKRNLLRSVSACVSRRSCEFQRSAARLAEASRAHRDGDGPDLKRSAQEAYQTAMLRWARIEPMKFGPAASAQDDMTHGRGLGDLIYSWPNVSRCRVEEQILGRAYESAGLESLVQVPINSRGLFAVEYLLFYPGVDNACSPFSITNAGDAWNLTPADDLAAWKRAYLGAVAEDVSLRARELEDAWSPEGGDYARSLIEGEGYMGLQGALNAVAQALMYVEVEVKDYKVGAAAGLYQNAPLERPEQSFAPGAVALLTENILGFRDVFSGCDGEGLGFDDWLHAVGHSELAADMAAGVEASLAALETFPDLSEASPAELAELHATLKLLTDPLKTEFFGAGSPLGLTLPQGVEGDTD